MHPRCEAPSVSCHPGLCITVACLLSACRGSASHDGSVSTWPQTMGWHECIPRALHRFGLSVHLEPSRPLSPRCLRWCFFSFLFLRGSCHLNRHMSQDRQFLHQARPGWYHTLFPLSH